MKTFKVLKRKTQVPFIIIAGAILFSGCATIIGGSRYYAHVIVVDYPDATISYKGNVKGNGYAAFKVPRKEANEFSVIVKEENCKEQTFDFTKRSFRGWALFGTITGWTGLINGIPIPWGIAVDGMTGALWKPDITEKGVTKTDYKHYNYYIDYTGCKQQDTIKVIKKVPVKNKAEKLGELIDSYNKGLINQEVFEREKKKILEEK